MATIRALRTRIRSVQNIRQITRAMEMVASTKLRRFQGRAEGMAPFAAEIRGLMGRLAADPGAAAGQRLLRPGSGKAAGFLLITSDRGLCGAYNTNVLHELERGLAGSAESRIYLFGRKGAEWLRKRGLPPAAWFQEPDLEHADFAAAQAISARLAREFESGAIGSLALVYTRFESMARFVPVREPLLPIDPALLEPSSAPGAWEGTLLEPGAEELLAALVPRYLAVQVHGAMMQALASEYASRRISMKNATDAAGSMKNALTRAYNQARQDNITRELLDIVGGAEALR